MTKALSTLKDGAKFKINKRNDAAVYEVVTKKKKVVTCSSISSKRTYDKPGSLKVHPCVK